MRKSSVVVIVMMLMSVTTAFADPLAIARAHDAAFDKATLACDVQTMNHLEQDHRGITQRTHPMCGFKRFVSTVVVLPGLFGCEC